MGIQAQTYASAVAQEILAVIANGNAASKSADVILAEVEHVAKSIKETADAGWY